MATDGQLVARVPVRTAAERIERTLACAILRGEHAPGSLLPSVRKLAARFDTTIPTVQRAIERLATFGLVQPIRGRGTVVCDPDGGDLALLPLWFEAFADDPDRSAKLLADLLEVRRAMAAHLFRHRRGELLRAVPRMAAPTAVIATSTDLAAIARADAALTEAVVAVVDNFALKAVLHTVAKLAHDVPHVAEALYADRAAHVAVVGAVVASFASSDGAPALAAMARWDAAAVEALRRRVASA